MFFSDPIPPGTPAQDFDVRDQEGNRVRLSELRGQNVVLEFYPKDETPTCRKQLCEFRDREELRLAKHTLVFGVNPGSAASHTRFTERNKFGFPLLVDEGGVLSQAV